MITAPKGPNTKAQSKRRGVSRKAQPWEPNRDWSGTVPVRDEPEPRLNDRVEHIVNAGTLGLARHVATFQVADRPYSD